MKRLRFILAHELGHWMIHQDYYKEIYELATKTSSDSDIRTEREADSLGTALLMTYGRVKVAFCRLKPKLTKEAAVTHMAQLFNVSVQAKEIRLKTIGLI